MTYPFQSICVFCGSADGLEQSYYDAAFEIGKTLAEKRITLIFGGGRTGMMGALAEGVMSKKGPIIGVVPVGLESPQLVYTSGLTRIEIVENIQVRKARMNELADAFIALPGGFGTMDELFEVLTLVQTTKVKPVPIILFDSKFWKQLFNFDLLVAEGMISPQDMELFHFVDTPQDAWRIITDFYQLPT